MRIEHLGIFLLVLGCSGAENTDKDTDTPADADADADADTDTDTDTDTGTATGCAADLGDSLADATDLGVLADVGSTCGSIDSTGYTYPTGFSGDQDWLLFEVPTAAVWELTLNWTADADLDILVYDSAGERVAPLQGDDIFLKPEVVYALLEPGEQYSAQIAAGDGFPGDWSLEWSLTTIDPEDNWIISQTTDATGVYDATSGTFIGTITDSYDGLITGENLCMWQQDVIDWASDPSAVGPDPYEGIACENSYGEPCTFAVTVTTSYGSPIAGDCTMFIAYQSIEIGLGWHDNADFYGYPVGPSAMYYNPVNGFWLPLALFDVPSSYDEASGVLNYAYPAYVTYGGY